MPANITSVKKQTVEISIQNLNENLDWITCVLCMSSIRFRFHFLFRCHFYLWFILLDGATRNRFKRYCRHYSQIYIKKNTSWGKEQSNSRQRLAAMLSASSTILFREHFNVAPSSGLFLHFKTDTLLNHVSAPIFRKWGGKNRWHLCWSSRYVSQLDNDEHGNAAPGSIDILQTKEY